MGFHKPAAFAKELAARNSLFLAASCVLRQGLCTTLSHTCHGGRPTSLLLDRTAERLRGAVAEAAGDENFALEEELRQRAVRFRGDN